MWLRNMLKKSFMVLLLALVSSQSLLTSTARAVCPAPVTTYGGASYSAPASTSGTFAVWSRVMVPDTTNKTFSLSIGDALCNVTVGNGAITPGQWTWVNYRDGNVDSKISIALTAGTYNVQLGGTKPGVKVDKIMLVQNLSCVPVNDGSNCVSTADTQAPTVPASLVSPSQTSESVSLSWGNSTDNTGVVRYDVFRGGTQIGSSTVNSFTESNLQAATAYSYHVTASDAAGNTSTPSNTLQVSTKQLADTTPPVATLVAPKTGDTLSNTAALNATAVDNRAVASIKFYLDDYTLLSTTPASTPTASATFNFNSTLYTNGSHRIHAVATDTSGNTSSTAPATITITNTFADTTAPTAPAGLTVGTRTTDSVALSWTASTDNVGVTGYEVYRNGARVATVTSLQHVDQFLAASTTYSYSVKAIDAAGNASGASTAVQATTLEAPDTTPPTVTLTAPVAGTISGLVPMTANASDNKAVAYVDFYANGYLVWRDDAAPYAASIETRNAPNSTVPFTAVAIDTSGNSTTSTPVIVTIQNVTPDTTVPTAPQNLLATAVSTSQINLSWSASTDNIGVVGYEVYRNSTKVATVTTPSYGDTGLTASTSYTYTIKALDAAGNASVASVAATAVTQSVQPPAVQYGALQGYVKEAATGKTLRSAKAIYILNGSKYTTLTDRAGYYYIQSLPYNTHNVTYSAKGFVSLTQPVVINSSLTSFDAKLNR